MCFFLFSVIALVLICFAFIGDCRTRTDAYGLWCVLHYLGGFFPFLRFATLSVSALGSTLWCFAIVSPRSCEEASKKRSSP